MANTKKRTTTTRTTRVVKETPVITEEKVVENIQEEVPTIEAEKVVEEPVKSAKKVEYANDDMIPCRSIVSGELLMEGLRTKQLYRWVACGDTIEVEYQDILAAIRGNSTFVYKPYILIDDETLVASQPKLEELYNSLYTMGDLEEILNMSPSQLRQYIPQLPVGVKESLKNLASSLIASGELDSINRIKVLDEIFGTDMVLMINLFQE